MSINVNQPGAREDVWQARPGGDGSAADRDAGGLVMDFHGLRHSFITLMAQSGIHPKVAQSLARHSTITLTMDRYAHVRLFDQAEALAQRRKRCKTTSVPNLID